MRYVNLGCGTRYHPEWLNFDLVPHSPAVRRFDVTRPLPLADGSCDVVYHAAVLEHIRRTDVNGFLRECHRVLRPGGVVRVGVPDLEALCRLYLDKLTLAAAGDARGEADYDWVMLELFDQMVRERSGGEMLEYLARSPLPNEKFVLERIGVEGEELLAAIRRPPTPAAGSIARLPGAIVRWLRGLLGSKLCGTAQRVGRFRLGGEIHQWMYDRFSLRRILTQVGFTEPEVRSATESRIADWPRFNLDTLPDGTVIKPDLFFLEAVKPAV